MSFSVLEQQPLRIDLRCSAVGGNFDAGPACDQLVVSASIFGLSEAFAKCVEPVRELAHGLGLASEGSE